METKKKHFALLLLFSLVAISTGHDDNKRTKLFVFGDSFVDTGNLGFKSSDGEILTDYIASFFSIKTPVNYAQKEEVSKSELRGGMNFAFAGSGVLDVSFSPFPLKMQVDKFREQIEQNVYTKIDLENSVALVSYTGNDYMYKTKKGGGTLKDVFDLTKTVVDLLTKNLREIRDLGVQKIAIFGTPPRGCFPDYYIELLQSCDETWNEASRWHNKLLEESLQDLNKESNGSKFVYLDLYNAFISALFNKNKGTTGYEDRFKACCQGGPMECFSFALAKKKCDHPELSIFWDGAHPSQYGASIIYSYLQPSLSQLL